MRFVDIHTHLIPELDDGAASLLETVEMLRYSFDRGTRAMVATPHMFASFGNTETIHDGLGQRLGFRFDALGVVAHTINEGVDVSDDMAH